MYDTKALQENKDTLRMPEPTGYHLLIALPEVKRQTEGKVHLPDELVAREGTASIIGFVLKMGPDCYEDKDKFPNGPWCKEGDFIMFQSYSGTRFKVDGQEFRLLNDDSVQAVIDDPRGYGRAV